jgi:hypothetical protein
MSDKQAFEFSKVTMDWLLETAQQQIENILETQQDVSENWREANKHVPPTAEQHEQYMSDCELLSDQYRAACEALEELRNAKVVDAVNTPITNTEEAHTFIDTIVDVNSTRLHALNEMYTAALKAEDEESQ